MKARMQTLSLRLGSIVMALAAGTLPLQAATVPDKLICGVENVEDMVALPGTAWIIGSGMGDRFFQGGGLHLINEQQGTARKVALDMPTGRAAQAPYDQCPGPVSATAFSAHGLSLRANADRTYNLYVVNHGARESIEIFKVTAQGGEPAFTWIGCVLTPKTAMSNSIAARPDGSLVLSATTAGDVPLPSFYDLSLQSAKASHGASKLESEDSAMQKGGLYTWTRQEGWKSVPNSQLLGNNGIELSTDGKWAFVDAWPAQSVGYVPLDPAFGQRRDVKLDFKPDNIRRAYDGKLVATGHVATIKDVIACSFNGADACAIDYKSVEIDPETLAVSPLFDGKGTQQFGTATIGLKTRDALWLGSVRSSCIARVQLDGSKR